MAPIGQMLNRATAASPCEHEKLIQQQMDKRMEVLLDDNCIETIKRLTPEGGEEIFFGGVMGGIKLKWNVATPASTARTDGWVNVPQDRQTLPSENTMILIYSAEYSDQILQCRMQDLRSGQFKYATHYRVLPAPPAAQPGDAPQKEEP